MCRKCLFWTRQTKEFGDCSNANMQIQIFERTPMSGLSDKENQSYIQSDFGISTVPSTMAGYSCEYFAPPLP